MINGLIIQMMSTRTCWWNPSKLHRQVVTENYLGQQRDAWIQSATIPILDSVWSRPKHHGHTKRESYRMGKIVGMALVTRLDQIISGHRSTRETTAVKNIGKLNVELSRLALLDVLDSSNTKGWLMKE